MSALVKYKNPTEYSFYDWINWIKIFGTDLSSKDKFLVFARTVCRYNAKRWKDTEFLEDMILREIPKFDSEELQQLLIIYQYLIDFFKTVPLTKDWRIEDGKKCKQGYYLECNIVNGKFYEEEKIIPKK